MTRKTTPRKKEKKDRSFIAGAIAFGASILAYASLFKFHRLSDFLLGGGISFLIGLIVKTMATPMKGLHNTPTSKESLSAEDVVDDHARKVVQTGLELTEQLTAESSAIKEHVFARRLTELKANVHKLLQKVIDDPDNAAHLRRINAYYLPTTIKLLQNYRSNKSQGLSYTEMSTSRQKLLDWLDSLIQGTGRMLEKIIKADLEDDDIEIEVLDQMLRADGLASEDHAEEMRRSAAAAARNATMASQLNGTPAKPATRPTGAAPAPAAKPAEAAKPAAEHRSEAPVINHNPASASAKQLQGGAPVLVIPDLPDPDDFDPFRTTAEGSSNK